MHTTGHADPIAAEVSLRALLAEGHLPQPDEVVGGPGPDEISFVWHEQKQIVIIELTEE